MFKHTSNSITNPPKFQTQTNTHPKIIDLKMFAPQQLCRAQPKHKTEPPKNHVNFVSKLPPHNHIHRYSVPHILPAAIAYQTSQHKSTKRAQIEKNASCEKYTNNIARGHFRCSHIVRRRRLRRLLLACYICIFGTTKTNNTRQVH